MKLTFKTLTKITFQVEIEPDKTVKELKETVEKEQGKEYPSGSQKLIYNGKILADESRLSEYQFDEKKFVVLMITRPPPAPKPPTADSASKQKSDEKPKPTTASTRQIQASTTPASVTTPSLTATATTTTESSTPAPVTTSATTRASSTATRQQQQSASTNLNDMGLGEPQLAQRLAAMVAQPQFRQMQDLIQQSPHLLSSTIETLSYTDPDMYNFITENPDVFVHALSNHPPVVGARPSSQRQQAGQGRGEARGGVHQPVMEQVIPNVSEHDKEAIERLKELGFSEYLAVQAYIACDKDEQLAANLLFQMEQ